MPFFIRYVLPFATHLLSVSVSGFPFFLCCRPDRHTLNSFTQLNFVASEWWSEPRLLCSLCSLCAACNRSWPDNNDDDDNDDEDGDAAAVAAADIFAFGRYPPDPRTCCHSGHGTADLWQVPQHRRRERDIGKPQAAVLPFYLLPVDRRSVAARLQFNWILFLFLERHLGYAPAPFSPRLCLSHLGNFNIILSGSSFSFWPLLLPLLSVFFASLFFVFSCVLIQSKLCILHNYNIWLLLLTARQAAGQSDRGSCKRGQQQQQVGGDWGLLCPMSRFFCLPACLFLWTILGPRWLRLPFIYLLYELAKFFVVHRLINLRILQCEKLRLNRA